MIGSFNFNNIESSSFNLICKSVKRPLLPVGKTSRVELASASGAYDFGQNEYSLRTITMRIAYLGTSFEELRARARQIAAWLSTTTWARLIINDEHDKYYLAKITAEVDLQTILEFGTAEITFDCQPFAYSVTGVTSDFDTDKADELIFVNPGTREINFKSPQGSRSLITVTGTWTTLSLSLNGKILNYNVAAATSKVLVIDNVLMEATLDGLNIFGSLGGDIDTFLPIIPGENSLSVDGTGLLVNAAVDFIPMWM